MTGEQDDRDELGGLLRRSAQGAAPLPYDAADARGRADARRRRTTVLGGVGTAAVALSVTAVVATASGGSTALQQQPAAPAPATAPSSAAVPTPSSPSRGTTAPAPPTAPGPAPATAEPSGKPLPTAPVPDVVLPTYDTTAGPGRPPGAVPTQPPPTVPEGPPETVGGEVELRGDDLGVTRVGAPRAQAVAAISAALGQPTRPQAVGCIGADEELAWGDFRLALGTDGRVNGWSSTSTTITTPSGIRVGTSVQRLRDLLGDRLQVSPANPDNPEGFRVVGVEVFGHLSGTAGDDTVTRLFNGACSGP